MLQQNNIEIAKLDIAITNIAKTKILKSNIFDCLEITIIEQHRTIELESNYIKYILIAKFSFVKREKFASIVIVNTFLILFKQC